MSAQTPDAVRKRFTVPDFAAARAAGRKLTVVTAYDFTGAAIADAAGVDCLLVGDSLGMVVQGHPTVLPVTLDDMVYHTRAVVRGSKHPLIVTDLPFLTYQVSPAQALVSAGRLVQEGGAHAVKLEGGERTAAAVEAIVRAGVPVMGHVGLTPQSVHALGGFKVQRAEEQLLRDARSLEAAGAFAVVVEAVPAPLGKAVTEALAVPTIGIGAGADCSGQVLVFHDLLGLYGEFRPRFVKRYADLATVAREAIAAYCEEVRSGQFPGPEHQFR